MYFESDLNKISKLWIHRNKQTCVVCKQNPIISINKNMEKVYIDF